MMRPMHVEAALDRDTDAAPGAATPVAAFTLRSNRIPAAAPGLRAPAEPCESMWEALEALHRKLQISG